MKTQWKFIPVCKMNDFLSNIIGQREEKTHFRHSRQLRCKFVISRCSTWALKIIGWDPDKKFVFSYLAVIFTNPLLIENVSCSYFTDCQGTVHLPVEISHRLRVIHRSNEERTPQNVTLGIVGASRKWPPLAVADQKWLEKCFFLYFREGKTIKLRNRWRRQI